MLLIHLTTRRTSHSNYPAGSIGIYYAAWKEAGGMVAGGAAEVMVATVAAVTHAPVIAVRVAMTSASAVVAAAGAPTPVAEP